ncbi:neuroligin-4, X-linked-like [Coccinella septempunctata]|uniref:neuroligin-4, X-linked-like n=1 Tax=Coccinella septempunctata TaxID=41139 RepID=UPI001D069331|nr:neuroligin-4, X-linked-like [Coccinella septempunctata]
MGMKSRGGMLRLLVVYLEFVVAIRATPAFMKNAKISTRIVQTRYGRLQGLIVPMDQYRYLKPIEVFLGVPYATPPVQSNRFSPTRAPSPWDGVRISDKMGPVCPQKLPDISNETAALERMPKGRLEYLKRLYPYLSNQSEDCLYLNVFSPTQVSSETRHPVIVYIHGESFEWNSGNSYDGSVLASYADLVVVTLNYRLGILGFLNANPAPHLKARVANYGLMDQIAALHWIQKNIALFGGDPSNVTLVGHGSGAACINFLMISPTVMPGLFHRAILLSGSALSSWALVEDPVNYAVKLAREVNCTIPEDVGKDHEMIVDCLRDAPLDHLLHADVSPPAYLSSFGPSVDGVVIKTDFAKELVTYFKPSELQSFVGAVNANMKRSEATITPRANNPYDLLFGVVTSEALWRFSSNDIQSGFEGERRDKIIRTYVRNAYTYHLSEIFFTVVNEYTDWERTVQHPINTRDATVQALSDAQYVAPLVQTGDLLSVKTAQNEKDQVDSKTFFYVFDYQTKEGDYPQRMGTVHGEELPYLFGAPLVDGFNHFPRNYSRAELALAESFIIFIANFARTGNPNEHHKQEPVLAASRERNRFRSILWDEYDSVHQKYLEIGMKPRMKNHFRAHQLSVWLRLIPELHRAGMEDVVARHNLFRNHNNADLYDGPVRPDPLSRVSYYDPTMELIRRRPNSTLTSIDVPTTIDTIVTTCVNVVSASNFNHQSFQNPNSNATDPLASLEAAGYAAYSTALSVTIAIGCSLLVLNVLIFAGVYYQRDKTRLEVKSLQQQQRNQSSFETISKHSHYHLGHSQSSNIIVDVEQDTSAMILSAQNAQEMHAMSKQHLRPTFQLPGSLSAPPPSPNDLAQNQYKTLPKNSTNTFHSYNPGSMTLPKNTSLMNNSACVIAELQQGMVQPPNGNPPIPMNVPRPPPPPRSKSPPENQPLLPNSMGLNKGNMRVPQAAMSEMRV